MPAERAGYTLTMFVVDVSKSMGTQQTIELSEGRTKKMSRLEHGLRFVKLKIQEMTSELNAALQIYDGRKTDQCAVLLFGSEDTNNILNETNGEYESVSEYVPIGQPNAGTLAKLDALEASPDTSGDPMDALIVAIETQNRHLAKKASWTRKVVIVTDGESPIEVEEWEATVQKMLSYNVHLTVVGIDFDDAEFGFKEEIKSRHKEENEKFYRSLEEALGDNGVVGNCDYALQEVSRPDVKITKSVLMGTVLRLGDVDARPEEALEILVKTSKCTAIARPKSWKKFTSRKGFDENSEPCTVFTELRQRTRYVKEKDAEEEDGETEKATTKARNADEDDILMADVKAENVEGATLTQDSDTEDDDDDKMSGEDDIDKEQLVRGFKYGTDYVPCPEGQFERLPTKKGMDICGFFKKVEFRRDYSMGEVQYVWADPANAQQQVALSSIVKAMKKENVMAIARWVSKDGMDPKMGVLEPCTFDLVDCLLWSHMPFADDVRKYTFASLDRLVSKKGELVAEHAYIPTQDQLDAMDKFVDSMNLMDAGDKDEDGNRTTWFDTRESYNPAVHRVKQAMFHSAVVNDLEQNPLPPPHEELLKYFDPPKRVLKRSRDTLDTCIQAFKVKEVPKKVGRVKKDTSHAHVLDDEDDEMLLLDKPAVSQKPSQTAGIDNAGSETEDSDEELLLDKAAPAKKRRLSKDKGFEPLPTPARSQSPAIDNGREPGRIIGTTYPLKDFKANISRGDLVTKAVEDFAFVIRQIVTRPFAHRRQEECLECLRLMRDTCLKEDEIDAWNTFLRDLKEGCVSQRPGNKDFWKALCDEGVRMSLISGSEAAQQGGSTNVTDEEAERFLHDV